mmetsp:Transcript_8446/g.14241  ORF Transcript_8446/g.14241 Transcript_8446/m.14241 type:complete len:96 (+) Transcript_8446:531-818(+)
MLANMLQQSRNLSAISDFKDKVQSSSTILRALQLRERKKAEAQYKATRKLTPTDRSRLTPVFRSSQKLPPATPAPAEVHRRGVRHHALGGLLQLG